MTATVLAVAAIVGAPLVAVVSVVAVDLVAFFRREDVR